MSKTEDYLDGLLESMEGKTKASETEVVEETEVSMDIPLADGFEKEISESNAMTGMLDAGNMTDEEKEFLDSFEREFLAGDDSDDFIRQFEEELAKENMEEQREERLDNVMEDDGINDMEEVADMEDLPLSDDDMDIMIDTIGEDIDATMRDMEHQTEEKSAEADEPIQDAFDDALMGMSGDSLMGMGDDSLMGEEHEISGTDEEADLVSEEQDLMDLLQSDGDFSDIGDILKADEENVALSDDGMDDFGDFGLDGIGDEPMLSEEIEEEEPKSKKRKKKAKKEKAGEEKEASGFVQKISNLLFGGDEEEEKAANTVKVTPVNIAPSIEELSDENLQILQALEGGATEEAAPEPVQETEEEEKARKKQEKKEKKEKAKAEKKEKKEAAKKAKAEKKAKKPKKEKKPKEPDNTPPLPKKPVVLVFVMVASFMALVLLGTNLFGYSNSIEKAKQAYDLGNYELAYKEVSGMELKEQDIELYEKYRVMANVSGEFSAYQSFMESNLYDMALDSLIRTVGRCQKYQAEAESYGCMTEMTRLQEQTTGALASFGLTQEQALELYGLEDREEYSAEIYAQIELAGFSMD